MGIFLAHLGWLLAPEDNKVQLDTVRRAEAAVGWRVKLVLV